MARPVRTFDMQSGQFNEQVEKTNEVKKRKPLIQLEPSCFYEDKPSLDEHSSIPQGVDLKREEVSINNVELNNVEKALQKVGIIPSDAWISGKSKNLWVNLATNIVKETFGVKPEEELAECDYIIELPTELAKVDNLEPSYQGGYSEVSNKSLNTVTKVSDNYDLFYSEEDDNNLDNAPSCCEIYK